MYAESSVGCLLCYCAMLRLKIAHHSAVAQVNSAVPLGNHFPRWCMLVAVTFQNLPNLFLHFRIRPFKVPQQQAHYKFAPLLELRRYWKYRVRFCLKESQQREPVQCVSLSASDDFVRWTTYRTQACSFDYREPTAVLDNTLGYRHYKQITDIDTGLRCHKALLWKPHKRQKRKTVRRFTNSVFQPFPWRQDWIESCVGQKKKKKIWNAFRPGVEEFVLRSIDLLESVGNDAQNHKTIKHYVAKRRLFMSVI